MSLKTPLDIAPEIVRMLNMAGPLLDTLIGDAEGPGPLRKPLKRAFARILGTADIQKAMWKAMRSL